MTNTEIVSRLTQDPTDPQALAEYAKGDMVILQCPECERTYYSTDGIPICETCLTRPDRLLTTGKWQTAEQRQRDNERQEGRVRG